jgi:hypothetical protein
MNPTIIRLDAQASRIDHSAGRIDFWRSQAIHFQQEVAALTELCERLRNEKNQAEGRARDNSIHQADQARTARDAATRKAAAANLRADAREAELRDTLKMLVEAAYDSSIDPRAIGFKGVAAVIRNNRAVARALTKRHTVARELAKLILAEVEIGGANVQ